MSDQVEKKACGWRVRVRNAIKVVSSNRKTTRVKNEVVSLKSSKFFTPDSSTLDELLSGKSECGDLMMLEAAQAQFGITPKQKTFRGQKILVYTLPTHLSDHQESEFKIPVEKATAHPIQKVECNSEPVVKEIEETAPVKKNGDIESKGFPDGNAAGIRDNNATGMPDGKAILENKSSHSELKHSDEVEENQSYKKPSLFSQPVPMENSPAKGMYFGTQPINLQLNVK